MFSVQIKKFFERFSLKTKFFVATATIIVLLTLLISSFVYFQYKRTLLRYTHEKTRLLMAEAEAARKYVQEILRPKMYSILPRDKFIVEAMSTSFVTRKVMGKVAFLFKGMTYKRASTNPRNPANLADQFEQHMIRKYNTSRDVQEWQGIVTRGDRKWFVAIQPIYMKKSCLRCHGDPKDAPSELIESYGKSAGFYRIVGKVAGLDEVAIPVDNALATIHKVAYGILGIGFSFVLLLFIFVGLFFDKLVYKPLKELTTFCKNVEKGEKSLADCVTVTRRDEIGQLAVSFNRLLKHLDDVQVQLLKYSEDLESLVSERTSELNRNKKFLEAILSTSPIGFLVVDRKGIITLWNNMATKISGLASQKVIGKHIDDVILPLPKESLVESLEKRNSRKREQEYCFINPEGATTHILVNQSIIVDELSNVSGLVVNFIDITEMKRLHEELNRYTSELESLIDEKVALLKESEERYREIFENANDAIVFLDSESFEIIDVNPAWQRLSGYKKDELLGEPFVKFLVPDDTRCAERCLEQSNASACSLEIRNKENETVAVELISSSFVMDGRPYVMSIIRDITTRKRLEKQLIDTNSKLLRRNKALHDLTIRLSKVEEDARRQFAGILHDELGQDLTAIKINIGMLIQRLRKEHAGCVSDLEKVQRLLGKVISVTRDLTSEMYPTILDNLGLAPALNWYLGTFSSKFGIEAVLEGYTDLPKLNQEVETLLFRFIQEALLNCAKHSEATGVKVIMKTMDSEMTVKIVDNGKGFDTDSLEYHEMSGIGLHIIRERMNYLGGALEIDSEIGVGTTIILKLPFKRFLH